MRTWLKAILMVSITLLSLAVVLACAEAYLRFRGLGDPVIYYTNSSYRYAPMPNQRKERVRHAIVTIDSAGLRGAGDWFGPADLRILFIGDSVTFGGTSIDDRQTFAHLTAVRLQELSGLRVTSGNAGVNAYGTDNMAARLRYGTVDNEDVIVVTLLAQDTVRGLADLRSQHFFDKPITGVLKATKEALNYALFRAFWRLRYRGHRKFDGHRLDVARRSLEDLFEVLREKEERGKAVLVVVSPVEDELGGKELELTRHVRQVVATSGFRVLDLHETVTREHTAETFLDGTHLDVRGHELYASLIADELFRMLSKTEDAP